MENRMSWSDLVLRRRRKGQGQKGYYRFAHGLHKTSRTSILNHLVRRNGYRDYLEIGVHAGDNFARVRVAHKVGVDPSARVPVDYALRSDEFFARLAPEREFDLVFVDGLHSAEQALRDILNALRHLRPRGSIVVHDCNPPSAWHQREIRGDEHLAWNGTTWRAWAQLRCEREDLRMHVVDTDWGVGIVQRGRQESHRLPAGAVLDYVYLDRHRAELLPVITVEEFLQMY
jgi:SAM-dependent methyltransferase